MAKALGEKGSELIKELKRKTDGVPQYNEEVVRQVIEEINTLVSLNQRDAVSHQEGRVGLYPSLVVRHAAIERNKRCALAYHLNRLERIKAYRLDTGSVLPPDVRASLSESEINWFHNYNRSLAKYMQSLGEHGGIDLAQDQQPPKSLHIQVRVLKEYGEFETSDGTCVMLQPDTVHSLLRTDCETLIRQGVLEQITLD